MSRYTTIGEGSGWTLGLWQCAQAEPGPHPPERSLTHLIVFPTHGAYARRVNGVRELLDATRVVYFNALEWYEVDHPVGGGDRCTVLSLDPALVESMAGEPGGFRDRPGHGPRFAALSRISTGRLHLAQRMLVARAGRRGDPVALDVFALELVAASLPAEGRVATARAPDTRAERRHRQAVERALEKIHAEFRSPLTIAGIARAAAYSPFHLCRVFRSQVGTTLHRYINRLRLRAALEEVLDRRGELSTVALRHGFASHSHFTDAFRREFGRTPTGIRTDLGRRAAL